MDSGNATTPPNLAFSETHPLKKKTSLHQARQIGVLLSEIPEKPPFSPTPLNAKRAFFT